MNLSSYIQRKAEDLEDKKSNITVSIINSKPTLTVKKYDPDNGKLLSDIDQVVIEIPALEAQVIKIQADIDRFKNDIDNINELITDAKAVME